jgi:hypothetical protein
VRCPFIVTWYGKLTSGWMSGTALKAGPGLATAGAGTTADPCVTAAVVPPPASIAPTPAMMAACPANAPAMAQPWPFLLPVFPRPVYAIVPWWPKLAIRRNAFSQLSSRFFGALAGACWSRIRQSADVWQLPAAPG